MTCNRRELPQTLMELWPLFVAAMPLPALIIGALNVAAVKAAAWRQRGGPS